MLEPLIVLTVLNCFFMFSSTVTTCALWWQYRSHKCCFKKDPMHQSAKHALSKLKSSYASKTSKKSGNPKEDNSANVSKLINRDESKSNTMLNTTANRDSKKRKLSKQRTKSNLKHLSQNRTPSEVSSTEMMENWDLEERTRMSEASQTANDGKSAVVMEYSTVQKIVQILDDDADLMATKLAIKDLNNKKHEERNTEYVGEPKYDPPQVPVLVPTTPI